MKYVQGPMTTEIIGGTQTMDSLCPLYHPLHSHPGLEWLMSGTDGKMRSLHLLSRGKDNASYIGRTTFVPPV